MLERAKARREKLDTQLSNAGHDVKRRRSPLRDANTLLSSAPGINLSFLSKKYNKKNNFLQLKFYSKKK